MKSALLLLAALALATPALAQNAAQIAHAKAGSSCPGCNLFQADFASAELKGKSFAHTRLRQADFGAAIMNHTNFASADLTHASFVGAFLQGANFSGAKLVGTNFSGAEMDRASGLTQHQLDEACGDSSTKLPAALHLPACR